MPRERTPEPEQTEAEASTEDQSEAPVTDPNWVPEAKTSDDVSEAKEETTDEEPEA